MHISLQRLSLTDWNPLLSRYNLHVRQVLYPSLPIFLPISTFSTFLLLFLLSNGVYFSLSLPNPSWKAFFRQTYILILLRHATTSLCKYRPSIQRYSFDCWGAIHAQWLDRTSHVVYVASSADGILLIKHKEGSCNTSSLEIVRDAIVVSQLWGWCLLGWYSFTFSELFVICSTAIGIYIFGSTSFKRNIFNIVRLPWLVRAVRLPCSFIGERLYSVSYCYGYFLPLVRHQAR